MADGAILKADIMARELRMKDVAREAGMDKSKLSEYIHGDRDLTPTVAAEIRAAIFRLDARRRNDGHL